MPADLGPQAAAEWKRLVPVLKRLAVIGAADRAPLAALCEAIALERQAFADLLEHGLTVSTNAGPRQNPAYRVWRGAVDVIHKYAAQYGLTVAARARLEQPDQEPKADGKDRFIRLAGAEPAGI